MSGVARKRPDINRVVEVFNRQGWYPAPWVQHPPEIKAAIRALGWRPRIKECFANCQRFLLQSEVPGLEYREGWIRSVIPMTHAWLVYKGERLDLTLRPAREDIVYMESIAYSEDDVRRAVVASRFYAPVNPAELERIGPFRAAFEALQRENAVFKTCSCGRQYTRRQWEKLPYVGEQDDFAGGVLELRNCPCETTLSIQAR